MIRPFHRIEKQARLDDECPCCVRARRSGHKQNIYDHSARRNDGPLGGTKQAGGGMISQAGNRITTGAEPRCLFSGGRK